MNTNRQAGYKKHPPRQRRLRGFYTAGHHAAPALRQAFGKRGFAEARILTDWPQVIGAALADMAQPQKLTRDKSGFGGTLVLAALGAYALEIQHKEPQILERINRYYGYRAVTRLSIRQVAELPRQTKTTYTPPQPTAEEAQRVEILAASLANERLRSALERLGKNIMARQSAHTERQT